MPYMRSSIRAFIILGRRKALQGCFYCTFATELHTPLGSAAVQLGAVRCLGCSSSFQGREGIARAV